jgi:predicted RecA/RadA family phage recombinase
MAISTTKGKFRKTGGTLDYTASADVSAGDIIVVDGLACLAQCDIANGATGVLKILQRGEVVEVATDDAIGEVSANTAIYLDGDGLPTTSSDDGEDTPTPYRLFGYTAADVGATDLKFKVICV